MNKHLRLAHDYRDKYKQIADDDVLLWFVTCDYGLEEAWYDRKHCIDRFIFSKGKYIDYPVGELIFDLDEISAKAEKYDDISNDSGCSLISPRIQAMFLKYLPNQVKLFDTIIRCKDRNITNYKLVNIINTTRCIDHEKSIYERKDYLLPNEIVPGIRRFTKLELLPGSMKDLLIAREEEYHSNILVSGKFVKILKQEMPKPVGYNLYFPEDLPW